MSDYYRYNNPYTQEIYDCSINRDNLKGLIAYYKNDELIFQWDNVTVRQHEEIHGFSRILQLIPDKIATAIDINKEHLGEDDSGSFLIKIVLRHLENYSSEQYAQRGPTFVKSNLEIQHLLKLLCVNLDEWIYPAVNILAKEVIESLDPLLNACILFLDFMHIELCQIQRDHFRQPQPNRFDEVIDSIQSRETLKTEYFGLISEQ